MTETTSLLQSAETARSFATRIFKQYPHTSESLKWLNDNPTDFAQRIQDFDAVVTHINHVLSDPKTIKYEYEVEVRTLADLLEKKHTPSLVEANAEAANSFSHHSPVLKAFFQGKQEFGWADEEYDASLPAKSAMGIFLEGYGRYIGLRQTNDITKAGAIQYAFVEAFEAILLIDHPQSPLLADVKDWMKSDYHKFSQPIQRALQSS